MIERQLRKDWEEGVSTSDQDLLDRLWDEAKSEGLVDSALCYETDLEYLVAYSQRALKWRNEGGHRQSTESRKRRKEIPFPVKGLEAERTAVTAEYLAKMAGCDRDVYRFRKEIFGNTTISPEQARGLFESPAAKYFDKRLFKAWDIPIVGHHAELKSYYADIKPQRRQLRATIFVEPPGTTKEVQTIPWTAAWRSRIDGPRPLPFPGEDGQIEIVDVWDSALLGELRRLGEKLAGRYRWEIAEAVWFVLVGEPPSVPSIRVTRTSAGSMYHRDNLITLVVSPWISARTVYEAYRRAQQRELGRSWGGRPLSEKNLRLFRFVNERIDPIGLLQEGRADVPDSDWMAEDELVAQGRYMKVPPSRELIAEWNEQYPQWAYRDKQGQNKRGAFWRDYHRTRRTLAYGPELQKRKGMRDSADDRDLTVT